MHGRKSHKNAIKRPTHVGSGKAHAKAVNRMSMPRKAKKGSKRY